MRMAPPPTGNPMNTRVKQDIINHALAIPHEEVCGFIYQTENGVHAYPCVNVSVESKAETFEIDPADYVTVCGKGRVCGIYHSHIATEAFSEEDLAMAREMCLPLYLYVGASRGWHSYVPETYRVNPVGLVWTWGLWDCYETVRLHYRQTRGVYMTDYDRDESFEKATESLIVKHVADEGFSYVEKSAPIIADDVLLFRTPGSPYPHHLVVVVKPNLMLHHRLNQLSCHEAIDGAWLRRLMGVLRYTGKGAVSA